MIDRIDEILDGGALDEGAAEELTELLSPAANGAGFEPRAVLHVAEHPVVEAAVEEDRVPPELQRVLAEAIGAVSAMLGEWSGAPLSVQASRLRRRFDREQNKYEIVRDKLDTVDDETAADIVGSYLDTSPAPMFSKRLAMDFGDVYDRAQSKRSAGKASLTEDDQLLELLQFDAPFDSSGRELYELLEQLATELAGDAKAVAERALAAGDDDERLVAGVLAVREGATDLSHGLLMEVAAAKLHAPQSAAFAGQLAPSLARHVLGRFLVDVLNEGTPTEDLEVDETELQRAIVAARTVLPLIGSPLEEVEQLEAEHEETAERARRAWAFCEVFYG